MTHLTDPRGLPRAPSKEASMTPRDRIVQYRCKALYEGGSEERRQAFPMRKRKDTPTGGGSGGLRARRGRRERLRPRGGRHDEPLLGVGPAVHGGAGPDAR